VVIELLTFNIEPHDREEWLTVEERVWSRFLEQQPGFIRKEMWISYDDDTEIHAVIWWETMAQWRAISPETVARVDAEMGSWARVPTMKSMRVVRDC
jgi:uncharacterized protein (TIGR03792 family)